jgi:hypothetical protein
MRYQLIRLAGLMILLFSAVTRAAEPPVIPVGLDAYRQWDRWPQQRIGARAYMRSTYDRRGGNEGADASHFLYQLADDFNVALDVQGAGILYFARYNHWHGSPWHYVVDGNDTIVRETSTDDPLHPIPNSVFLPKEALPNPLTWTWSDTRGADLLWVPIGFEKSFQMAYSRTHYGTGYYIYDQYVPGAKLSQPINAWDGKSAPGEDVLKLINRSGSDLSPLGIAVKTGVTGQAIRIGGPGVIRVLTFSLPKDAALSMSQARLRITWDDRSEPSVDAPLALFFGAGRFYNRDGREFLVKSFPMTVRYTSDRVELVCYFPMPFFRSATITLDGPPIDYAVRYEPLGDAPQEVGYFHATYRDFPSPEKGKDLVLLDTRQTEGGGDWTGSFVGTSFIFSHNSVLGTLEGDPRFFFDDSESPQAQGTGTEEWAGGGDYWGGLNMTLPFAGHPCGARNAKEAKDDDDKIESAYRFLLADLFPFGKNARICLEHGGTDESHEHYETVTFWYGLPGATLIQTDNLKIADTDSEKLHAYLSPQASEPYSITSKYELGVDAPESTDVGRSTTGTSEFNIKLDPENFGVLLRRKLDYQFPNQRAEVSVADESGNWQPAGVWYLAGSNTCVYSNPKDELGATQHKLETSDRRFREDELLIGRELTRGRTIIRVRIRFAPIDTPILPGQPLPREAWSEIRYDAYCFVNAKSR